MAKTYIIYCTGFASVHRDKYPVNVYDVAWEVGEGDIERSQGTYLDVL